VLRSVKVVAALGLAVALAAAAAPASAQHLPKLKVGFCTRTINAAVAPFAAAIKMGWYRQEGFDVEVVPLPGSVDCVKFVVTREMDFSLPSVEPLATGRPQGVRAKIYYTAYQGNGYGLAVPDDSPIKRIADLKGKRVGVVSMASAGVVIARALATTNGLDPDRDISIVVAGDGAQTAAMLRNRQVDALSQFDTQYAIVENAGVKMRWLDNEAIERFPGNGFLALESALTTRRREAIAVARGYAKGTVFTLANPEAAVHILYEVYPSTRPTGKDEATAVRDDVKVIQARAPKWELLPKWGAKRWGENVEANYASYVDFLAKWAIIPQRVDVKDLVTNELLDEINRFDAAKIAAEAKAWKR
jgi:NitT/TauT family transport system substrate-binding protein